jgi:hypothetical protein
MGIGYSIMITIGLSISIVVFIIIGVGSIGSSIRKSIVIIYYHFKRL